MGTFLELDKHVGIVSVLCSLSMTIGFALIVRGESLADEQVSKANQDEKYTTADSFIKVA